MAIVLDSLNLRAAEKILITHALERAQGHIGQAAALAGVERNAFRRRMTKHRLRWELGVVHEDVPAPEGAAD